MPKPGLSKNYFVEYYDWWMHTGATPYLPLRVTQRTYFRAKNHKPGIKPPSGKRKIALNLPMQSMGVGLNVKRTRRG